MGKSGERNPRETFHRGVDESHDSGRPPMERPRLPGVEWESAVQAMIGGRRDPTQLGVEAQIVQTVGLAGVCTVYNAIRRVASHGAKSGRPELQTAIDDDSPPSDRVVGVLAVASIESLDGGDAMISSLREIQGRSLERNMGRLLKSIHHEIGPPANE
ncbi:MAG: hypothetical protein GF416_07260 [Candidatus Altiarchaeales archaeon]|nr:hypothetical protein [Candidatus Altiarchaeales archaeon]MBD3416910.1 hypothetical protein [Candidatus Altiarchaeales archaeon]